MGCDYYTYYVLYIQYKKDNETITHKEILEETRDRHYIYYIPERDTDFEEEDEYMKRCHTYRNDHMQNSLSKYTPKDILKDGKWLCVQSAQEKYKELCKELELEFDTVVAIWKEGGYHYR